MLPCLKFLSGCFLHSLGVCSPATARKWIRGRKGGNEHTSEREGAEEGTRGALPACATGLCPASSVPTGHRGTFLLDKSPEKERRSGALWLTGISVDQPTPCPDSTGPAFALTHHPAGLYQSQSNSGCCSARLMTGSLSRVKQSGDPFLLCDLPRALGAIPGTSFSACSLCYFC